MKPRPSPQCGRGFLPPGIDQGSKAGAALIMEKAQEDRISDVVAIAYAVLALLLMLVWAYVPA